MPLLIFVILLLAIGPRQFFDEEIEGLRYEDGPNELNKGRQFLDDETDSSDLYPSSALEDPPCVFEEFPVG